MKQTNDRRLEILDRMRNKAARRWNLVILGTLIFGLVFLIVYMGL